MAIIKGRVWIKRDTEENWNSKNPVLGLGEQGAVTSGANKDRIKIGDGKTAWNNLLFADDTLWKSIEEIKSAKIDNTPTQNSSNAVSSGGVFSWFGAAVSTLATTAKNVVGAINELFDTTVKTIGDQTIRGIKRFSDPIILDTIRTSLFSVEVVDPSNPDKPLHFLISSGNFPFISMSNGIVGFYLDSDGCASLHSISGDARFTGIALPKLPNDAVNKQYVDAKISTGGGDSAITRPGQTPDNPIVIDTDPYFIANGFDLQGNFPDDRLGFYVYFGSPSVQISHQPPNAENSSFTLLLQKSVAGYGVDAYYHDSYNGSFWINFAAHGQWALAANAESRAYNYQVQLQIRESGVGQGANRGIVNFVVGDLNNKGTTPREDLYNLIHDNGGSYDEYEEGVRDIPPMIMATGGYAGRTIIGISATDPDKGTMQTHPQLILYTIDSSWISLALSPNNIRNEEAFIENMDVFRF
jgi:hypothetical protein